MRWLHFILSHSIFISLCAVALCFQTYVLLGLKPDYLIYLLVFSCTLCSYNAYWLLSKFHFNKTLPFSKFIIRNFSNLVLVLLSSIAVLFCMIYVPGVVGFLAVAGMLTVFYTLPLWPGSSLKPATSLGFIKTLLLALTWTYVTIVIPAREKMGEIDQAFTLLFATRFFFMLMLCSIFDNRDSHFDKLRGLKSLATDVSSHTLHKIMIGSFCLYIIFGIALRSYLDSGAQTIAFLLTGVTVLLVYLLSLKKQDYIFYYFVVDGMMLFSATATFVAANV